MHIDIRVAGEAPWDVADRERPIRVKVFQLVAAGTGTGTDTGTGTGSLDRSRDQP
jgi:hypothetical protein